MTTDPTGRSFLSYRRSRSSEAELLIAAQHEVGIPTWQDTKDLKEEPTEAKIKEILLAPTTANAVMWLTPEVANSAFINRVEAPCILKRYAQNDGFFVIPVAAGGMNYGDAASVADQYLGITDLRAWNLVRFSANPITMAEAQELAARVLQRRLALIHATLATGDPLEISFNTRQPAMPASGALTIDWSHHFNGRIASQESWQQHLLPALEKIASAITLQAPGHPVVVRGFPSISAATALGSTFLAPRGLSVSWLQYTPGQPAQAWGIEIGQTQIDTETELVEADVTADDLAVLVSVSSNVEPAFSRCRHNLPSFRAILHIRTTDGSKYPLGNPGHASKVAHKVAQAIRSARNEVQPRGKVHLFMAVPVGLAMMLGQLLNTFGPVQLYEHDPADAIGFYRPSVLIRPSIPFG